MLAELMTPREVAAVTRLRLSTVYKYARERVVQSVLIANRLRFRRVDVERWVARGVRPAERLAPAGRRSA